MPWMRKVMPIWRNSNKMLSAAGIKKALDYSRIYLVNMALRRLNGTGVGLTAWAQQKRERDESGK